MEDHSMVSSLTPIERTAGAKMNFSTYHANLIALQKKSPPCAFAQNGQRLQRGAKTVANNLSIRVAGRTSN